MEVIEAIKTRRSVRKFTAEPVAKEVLEQVVAAAAYAPSWKNTQTSRYIAVTDPAVKQALLDGAVGAIPHNQEIIAGAPVVVALTTVNARSGYERDGSFANSKGTHWQSFDAGIAAEAFCLAAHAAGLGTVILGMYDEAQAIENLQVPEGQSVSALIAVGHPAEAPEAPKRKDVDALLSWR